MTVKKKSPSILMIVNLFSPDGRYDDLYLSNYATIQIRDELARLAGRRRHHLPRPARLQHAGLARSRASWPSRNLTASDVVSAIQQQNVQVAAGQIGQPPVPTGQEFQYTMTTLGRLIDAEQFGDIIVKTGDRRADAASSGCATWPGSNWAPSSYDQILHAGRPAVGRRWSIYQLPGSNALETAERRAGTRWRS